MNQARYMQIVIMNSVIELILISLFYFKVLAPEMDNGLRLGVCAVLALNLFVVPVALKLAVKD